MDNITVNDFMETDLGPVSPDPRGPYDNTATYEHLSLVELGGGSYLCTIAPGEVITGIAPEPGKTTEYWQVLTTPGDLTPEYIAMHDRVQNDARQVAIDRAAVELSEQNISGMETNVEQMQADVQAGAAQVAKDKDSAAGYAQAAETSRQAAAESEANVNAQVNGFDSHVQEKTTEATGTIETARQQAVSVVQQQGAESAQGVIDDTEAYFEEKKTDALSEISDKTTEVVKSVTDEGTKQIGLVDAAGAAQVAAVTQEGTDQIANIQMEAESYIRREDANKLAFKGKSGGRSHHVEDSADWGFLGMQGYGESTQVQTTGAQLVDYVNSFDTEYNGIKVKIDRENGVVAFTGSNTATFAVIYHLELTRTVKTGETVYLDAGNNIADSNVSLRMYNKDTLVGVVTDLTAPNKKESYTVPTDCNRLTVRFAQGATANITLRPMLATSDQPWEPYTGGAPSPSTAYPQEIVSKCQARQLFDASTITEESYLSDTSGQVVSGGPTAVGMNVSDYIPIAGYDYVTVTTSMTEKRWGAFYNADKSFLRGIAGYGTLAVPEGAHYMRLTIADDALDTCMINAGTPPGTWAPYGKYGLETVVEGENLCNPQALLNAGFVLQEDGSYFIDKANKPYLKDLWRNTGIKGQIYINYDTKHVLYNGKSGIAIYVLYKDGSQESAGTPGSESWVHTDFVTRQEKEVESIYFAYATSSASSYLRNVMISTAQSDYIPYTAQTLHTYLDMPLRGIPVSSGGNVTIDGQQYIADYRDWERGKHVQRVTEVIFDGSANEEWDYTANTNNRFSIVLNNVRNPSYQNKIGYCNQFQYDPVTYADSGDNVGYIISGARLYVRFGSQSEIKSVGALRTWLADNPLIFQLPLKTPIETDIPPEELLAYRRLHAYHGATNIHNSDDVYTALEYARDPDIVEQSITDRLTALETAQAQTAAAFSYLPADVQAVMIENETNHLLQEV